MSITTKKMLLDILFMSVTWLLTFLLVQWLVEGSFWLHFFLANALNAHTINSKVSELKNDLKNLDGRFAFADQELVRVSQLTDSQDDRLDDLEKKVYQLEDEINDLK